MSAVAPREVRGKQEQEEESDDSFEREWRESNKHCVGMVRASINELGLSSSALSTSDEKKEEKSLGAKVQRDLVLCEDLNDLGVGIFVIAKKGIGVTCVLTALIVSAPTVANGVRSVRVAMSKSKKKKTQDTVEKKQSSNNR
jgi:hypothetical protein